MHGRPNPDASNSNSASSGQPVEVRFKSNTKFACNHVPNPLDISDLKDGTSATNPGQSSVSALPQPQPIAEPELTEEEFKKIVATTKLSEPEVVEVDGLSGLGTVYHLCPSPSHKFLLCGHKGVSRVDSVQGRLKLGSVQKRGDECRDGSPSPLQCPRSARSSGCLSF